MLVKFQRDVRKTWRFFGSARRRENARPKWRRVMRHVNNAVSRRKLSMLSLLYAARHEAGNGIGAEGINC
jgi:hypothetical protein